MYTVMRAARMRRGWLAREAWKAWAVPWKPAWMEAGRPISRSAVWMARTAWPRETPGARLKESVTAGNWPWGLMARAGGPVSKWLKAESGTWAPVADLTEMALRASGACWDWGATPRTTWYWL